MAYCIRNNRQCDFKTKNGYTEKTTGCIKKQRILTHTKYK